MVALKTIEDFLNQKHIAIAGVSSKKSKFGNALYNELNKKDYEVYPVNPNLDEYEGGVCYHQISNLPPEVTAIAICTKPNVTKKLVEEARIQGLKHIWLQQGSADKDLIKELEEKNEDIVYKECLLMHAQPVGGIHGFHRWLKKSFGKFPS